MGTPIRFRVEDIEPEPPAAGVVRFSMEDIEPEPARLPFVPSHEPPAPPQLPSMEDLVEGLPLKSRRPVQPEVPPVAPLASHEPTPAAEKPGLPLIGRLATNPFRSLAAGGLRLNTMTWGALQAAADTLGLSSVSEWAAARGAEARAMIDATRGDQATLDPNERALYSGFESIGSSLPAVLAGVATKNPATTLGMMGAGTGGESYAEAREGGAAVPNALMYGLSQGAIEAATERIPASRLLGDLAKRSGLLQTVMRQVAAEVPGEQVATALQDLNTWAVLQPEKTFGDYLRERPSAASQTLIATLVSTLGTTAGASAVDRLTSKPALPFALREDVPEELARVSSPSPLVPREAPAVGATDAAVESRPSPPPAEIPVASSPAPGAPVVFNVEDIDTLDTGELQPRLPGAGDVRNTEVATPQIDTPFSLTGDTTEAFRTGQQAGLDLTAEPEKVRFRIEDIDDTPLPTKRSLNVPSKRVTYDETTDDERRELRRMLAEMETFEHTPRQMNEVTRGKGQAYEFVEGSAGAPVFNDIANKDRNGKAIGSREQVTEELKTFLRDGKRTAMTDRAMDVARRRLAGDPSLSKPSLPAEYGDLPGGMQLRRREGLSDAERPVERQFVRQIEGAPAATIRAYREKFGNVANSDLAKELAEGLYDTPEKRTANSRALHQPSHELARAVFRQLLEEDVQEGKSALAVFTAGGTGSGKSSSIDLLPGLRTDANVVYDSTFANKDQALEDVQAALDAGRDVGIVVTLRDIREAFVNGVLPRAMREGRPVNIDSHIRTHTGAPATVLAIAKQYADDPRVSVMVVENPATGDRVLRGPDLQRLEAVRYDEGDVRIALSEALEAEYQAGRISEAVAVATRTARRELPREADSAGPREPESGSARAEPAEGVVRFRVEEIDATPPNQPKSNPFRKRAEAARRRADDLAGRRSARDAGMAASFPLGPGVGRGTEALRGKAIDASVDQAVAVTKAEKEARRLEAQVKAFDEGRINAQGRSIRPKAGKGGGNRSDALTEPLAVSTGLTKSLPPAPLGKPALPLTPRMRNPEIIRNLRRVIGNIPVRTGHFSQQAYGIYKPDVQAIRLKVANNLSTFFHEAGHHFDEVTLQIDRRDPRWKDELTAMGQATSRPSYSIKQQRQEGAAEFMRHYLTNPSYAQKHAPNYFAEFERRLGEQPELRDGLLEVREDIQGLISQDPAARGRLRIDRRTEGQRRRERIRNTVQEPRALLRDLAAKTVDDLQPLRAAVEQMQDGRPVEYRMNAYVLARIARGSSGKAEAFLEHGVRGRNGKFIGPSLADAIAPVKQSLDAFGDYLVALRALELRRRGIEPGMAQDEAQAIVDQTHAREDAAEFERARELVYQHQDSLLEYARLYGGMSARQLAAIKLVNQAYVPMQRALDAAEGSIAGVAKRIANRELPIKRIKGSGLDVIDPFESMVKNAFAIVDMVEKNRAMQALVRQAEKSAGSGRWIEKIPTPKVATQFKLSQVSKDIKQALVDAGIEDLPDNLEDAFESLVTVWTPATFAKGNEQIVTVLRNGERQFWQVNDPGLYEALTVIGGTATSRLMALAEKPTKLLRAGATLTPGFILRNPGRDTLVAFLQSRYGFIPVYDTLRGLIAQVRGDADAKLFFTSGVAQAAMAAQHRNQRQEAVRRVQRAGTRGIPWNPVELLRAFSQWTETATRLGEFKLALEAGGVERGVLARLMDLPGRNRPRVVTEEALTRATLAARDVTTDFSRAGTYAREANELYAFFNANVQGKVRMAETIARDPAGTALKAAAIALFSAAVWALNEDDDEYQEKEAWEKHTYWHLPFAGGAGIRVNGVPVKWLRIPKPFDWGYPADITEAALDFMRQGDPTRFREMKESLIGTSPEKLVATLLPTFVLPLVEWWANYSAFRDTHIVQPWDLGLETDLQYGEWTSELAKSLGKVIPVAPAHIDNLIYGYTAGTGRGVVSGIDTAGSLLGLVPKKAPGPSAHVQQLPVVGNFLSDGAFGSGAQSLQDLYDLAEAIEKVEDSVKEDVKRGDRDRAQQRVDRATARLPIVWNERGRITEARKDLKDLAGDIRAVYAAPPDQLTPDEKRQRLDAIRAQMVNISRRALGKPALRRQAQ